MYTSSLLVECNTPHPGQVEMGGGFISGFIRRSSRRKRFSVSADVTRKVTDLPHGDRVVLVTGATTKKR